ncbi:hypothetical protein [Paenarthrobacter ilicis]|uniref:hypothetical protein n=1 Tax=Paenarthrobacter ilicis TaxID=43665 RepID=UPI0028D865C4|nr:hypothetical protein [Paenarthrobacter ilicis]
MTTKIKLNKDLAGHDKGDIIEVTDQSAERLIERGVADTLDATHVGKQGSDKQDDSKPGGSASLADWQTYAKTQGKTEDELKDLKRDDIRALFESDQA